MPGPRHHHVEHTLPDRTGPQRPEDGHDGRQGSVAGATPPDPGTGAGAGTTPASGVTTPQRRGHRPRAVLAALLAGALLASAVLLGAIVREDGDAQGDRLTWSPPALSDPVTYHVSGDGPGTLRAEPGQDSIVVFDEPVHRRIRMQGGRHWVIRGGEVHNDREWANVEQQAGLQFDGVTGTAFVEGVLIHGEYGKDGIRVGEGGSDTTLIVQNSRILDRMSGPDVYHADVIQPFGGVEDLKVDRLTGSGDYQGQMWKQEPGTVFGPSDFRRVNYRAVQPEVEYMINFVMSSPTQPVRLSEVYNEPDPDFVDGDFCRAQAPAESADCDVDGDGRAYVTWSDTPIDIDGRVTQGPPPDGDFVPDGVAGMDYESPGYR